MSTKYLVYPGYVRSRSDGDIHFITAQMLMRLYGVRPDECIVVRPDDIEEYQLRAYSQEFLSSLKHLVPRSDGNYERVSAQSKERATNQLNQMKGEK